MKNIFYYIAMFTLLLTGTVVVIVSYWLLASYIVVTFGPENTKLVETTVKSGGYLQIKQDYCKHIPLPATVSCEFIDGLTYTVPVYNSDREVGCAQRIEYKYVPKALPAGTFKMSCVYSYKVNPLRTVEYTLKTDLFTITK
jgi:hypothetical protein